MMGSAARAATIFGFTPDAGPAGTEVTITGSGLQNATVVLFGSMDAPGTIVSASAGQVRARVPGNAFTGPISVFAGQWATSQQIFVAVPRIEMFEPATGVPGTFVTISGPNMGANAPGGRGSVTSVLFNGEPAAFQVTAINQLVAVVPTNATTGPISVVNEAGTATSLDPFIVPAAVSGFDPDRGRPGDAVNVFGNNLGTAVQVGFGEALARYTIESPTNLVVHVPTNAVNSFIQVVTPAGVAVSSNQFIVLPRVIAFSPTSGRQGTNVVLQGGGFHGTTAVRFGDVAAEFTLDSSMQIRTVVPAGARTGPITVVTTNGTFQTETSFVLPAQISSVFPTTGSRGDTITINGQNLDGATAVQFNGVDAQFTIESATRITAVVPALATTGPIRVVTDAGAVSSTSVFTVEPVLDGFSPLSGPRGSTVQLFGAGLTNLAWVRLAGLDVNSTVLSSTNVRVVIPLNAYSGRFRIRTEAGSEIESAANFLVEGAQPQVTSFTPSSGGPGTAVTVNGAGFATATEVEFNGVEATFTVVSPSQLQATVPPGATTGPIAVTTLDGIAVSQESFVVQGSGGVLMTVEREDGDITFRWPVSAVGYVLESSSQLGPDAQWQPVPVVPAQEGDQFRATVPVDPDANRFFRLRLPSVE